MKIKTWNLKLLLFVNIAFTSIFNYESIAQSVVTQSFADEISSSSGVISIEKLDLAPYEEVVFYASNWWPGGGNRIYPHYSKNNDLDDGLNGGVMLLFKHADKTYSCYLAGANNDIFSWFSTDDGKIFNVNTGTLGTANYSGENKILYTEATAQTAYAAINEVWKLHLESEFNTTTVKLREEKRYPEYFNYLGWCSWESYFRDISEKKLMEAVKSFEADNVPIRYLLMDAGHQQYKKGQPFTYHVLERFYPNPETFPSNYANLLNMRKIDKVRWMGIWLSFLGGHDGIHPTNQMPDNVKAILSKTHMNTLMPSGSRESADIFYKTYIDIHVTEPGWDFAKVDFMSRALTHYAGGEYANIPIKNNKGAIDNPYLASSNLTIALEEKLASDHLGLINCNSQCAFSIFNNSSSVVTRCSEDYKLYDLGRARGHLFHSYSSMPYLGNVLWGDHDMFHSSDTVSGKMMAISKAISGGPIYLSDEPNHFDLENISPLCYSNGELIRPLAPAVPSEKALFIDPQTESKPYIVFAPLANKSVAVVAYNLYAEILMDKSRLQKLAENNIPTHLTSLLKESGLTHFKNHTELFDFLVGLEVKHPELKKYRNDIYNFLNQWANELTVSGEIYKELYQNAGVMMQPVENDWNISEEGIICYDWYAQKAQKLNDSIEFEIEGFGDRLYHLVPVNKGWALIGDVSKYLSPAACKIISLSKNKIKLELEEGGEIVVFNNCKTLSSNYGEVSVLGSDLWKIVVPKNITSIQLNVESN